MILGSPNARAYGPTRSPVPGRYGLTRAAVPTSALFLVARSSLRLYVTFSAELPRNPNPPISDLVGGWVLVAGPIRTASVFTIQDPFG
jgi:hypothetical protein